MKTRSLYIYEHDRNMICRVNVEYESGPFLYFRKFTIPPANSNSKHIPNQNQIFLLHKSGLHRGICFKTIHVLDRFSNRFYNAYRSDKNSKGFYKKHFRYTEYLYGRRYSNNADSCGHYYVAGTKAKILRSVKSTFKSTKQFCFFEAQRLIKEFSWQDKHNVDWSFRHYFEQVDWIGNLEFQEKKIINEIKTL